MILTHSGLDHPQLFFIMYANSTSLDKCLREEYLTLRHLILGPFSFTKEKDWSFGKTSSSTECAWNSWTQWSFWMVASSTSEMWHLIGEGSLGVNVNNLFSSKLWSYWTNGKWNQKGQVSHSSFLLSFEEDEKAESLWRAEGLWRANFCISLIIPEHTDRSFCYPCGTT